MQKDQKQSKGQKGKCRPRLELNLIEAEYAVYEESPEAYLMAKIEKDNPWPQHHLARIETFLKQISALYNPIAYHNLTHAFDVMVHLDLYFTQYGWQKRLAISAQKVTLMLIAAYAHDTGHEGLSNSFYKNSKHPLASASQSPLQAMHSSNLMQLLAQNNLELDLPTKRELTEMILKTDNFHHFQLVASAEQFEGMSENELRSPERCLMLQCLLLHAADLNNTAKRTELTLRWTGRLYQQFEHQNELEVAGGLPLSCILGSQEQRLKSSVSFLDHLALPLFRSIANLQPQFQKLAAQVQNNKQHYLLSLSQFK